MSESSTVFAYLTYEDYVDSQVGAIDRVYLEDADTQRALVELGYRGSGETLSREEFEARKKAEREKHLFGDLVPRSLCGAGKDFAGKPLLEALAAREEHVRNGKLFTIIFLRDTNARGMEVSAYIDFAQRLKMESWEYIFSGKEKLVPKPTDMCFYNWATGAVGSNPSPNFTVLSDTGSTGLLFKVKRDRKIICVDPKKNPGDNTTRIDVTTSEVLQAVLFDHYTK